jgi:hypothetical protein
METVAARTMTCPSEKDGTKEGSDLPQTIIKGGEMYQSVIHQFVKREDSTNRASNDAD